ncbi:hypothetical protein [Pseudonocardia xishanensis]|uniref:Uncharacterized protein n=1 Tax=Pseudonocardia xishanensis TaxID=630995 RepID=A0ABP8RR66_9PSEU
MLLLVLVLVLIAFGLLVVALLSGSVMWAWISVAVSVAAAVALLVDWLQRRSAVKAGAEPDRVSVAPSQAPVGPPASYRGVPDIEPVTEVIPLVPHATPGGVTGPDTTSTGAGPDAEATSVMPLVEPSGSAGRPSGAEDTVTRSSGSSSPSVTDSDAEADTADPAHEAGEGRPESAAPEAELEGAAPRDEQGPGRAGGSAAAGSAGSPAEATTADVSGGSGGSVDGPTVATPAATASHGAHEAPGAAVSDAAVPDEAVPDAAVPPSHGGHGGHGAHEAPERSANGPAAAGDGSQDPVSSTAGAEGGTPVAAATRADPDRPQGTEAPRDGQAERADAAPPAAQFPAGVPVGQVAGGQPPAGNAPGPHGEPPEEPRDAEVAALVSGLDDEVVVVDEQPRYHLAGCRSLPGRPVIPLPAKEAVELGFTPCGWCTPDRTMAGRHQPAAH